MHTSTPSSHALYIGLLVAVVLSSLPNYAATQPTANPTEQDRPRIAHTPPNAWEAGTSNRLSIRVFKDWRAREFVAFVRTGNPTSKTPNDWITVVFKRSETDLFIAPIPQEIILAPGVEYTIASIDAEGKKTYHVATPQNPVPIPVMGKSDEEVRAGKLLRHNGHLSTFELRGQWTQFGPRAANFDESRISDVNEGDPTNKDSDNFWTAEARYTYRMLGVLYAIDFGAGFMRGERAQITRDGQDIPLGVDVDTPSPGINYGWGGLTLELFDLLSVDTRLLLGADEEGFVAGWGGLVRIGEIEGTRLEIGTNWIGDIGNTAFFRFAWDTVPHVPMSLTAESTSWPDNDTNPNGTRLVYEASLDFNALRIGGRIGTATRFNAISSGWTAGVHTAYSF